MSRPSERRCDERRHSEQGAIAIEMALLVPVLVAGLVIIVMAGEFVSAKDDVSNAAYAAARAAAFTDNPAAAQQAAITAASAALGTRGDECASLATSVDTRDFVVGGNVSVTVTCVADIASISGFPFIPGHKAFTSTAVVPLGAHRDL